MKNQKTSLTDGSVIRDILLFTGPLLIGNLFQQLYNTTDSFIIGNFVGNNALAAIGASGQVVNLLIGFVIGLTTGAGIIIAQAYGASDQKNLHLAIHTSFWFCLLAGIVISAVGFLLSPLILRLMNTPAEVIPDAILYLRIYFLGTIFILFYNMGAGTLQASGDTKHPLYYLALSSVINVILDILFVTVFRMAMTGVALATLIAQLISALCVYFHLTRTQDICRLNLREIRCHRPTLKKVLLFGVPAGLQSAIVSLSNVIVQGYLNGFGSLAMAGNNIYGKVDSLVLLPVNCLSLTTTTFIAQNIGARKAGRIKKGFFVFLALGNLYAAFVGILLFFFSHIPLKLFTPDEDVIRCGVMMAKVLGPGYFLLITCQILIGISRGAGHTLSTMILSTLNLCGLRILWLTIMIPLFPSIYTLYLGYPVTWGTAALCMGFYYQKKIWPQLKEKLPDLLRSRNGSFFAF